METARPNRTLKAILLLLENSQGHVSRTKLVKLLFLADLKSHETLGTSISGLDYQRYFYGPFSEKIIDAITLAKDYEIEEQEGISSSGRRYFSYKRGHIDRTDMSSVRFSDNPETDNKMTDILINTGKQYGSMSTDDILKRVYALPQFLKTDFGEQIQL